MSRSPLQHILSLVVLAIIWGGAWFDYRSHTGEHRVQFDKLGSALVGAAEGSVMRLCRGGRYDPEELAGALEELRSSVGAERLVLFSESEGTIAEAATDALPESASMRVFETAFVPPQRRGFGRRGPGPPGLDELPAGGLVLELDLSTSALDERLTADLRRFLGLALALSAALLLFVILLTTRERSLALARELGSAQAELRGLEFLRRLGAGIAHETRNPLGILRGFAQELAGGDVAPERVPVLAGTIIEEADRTVSRLDEFLLLSRPAELRRERFELRELLVELGALLQPDLEAAGASLVIEEFELEVDADREQTRRLFMNLLLNGVQALPAGGTLRVEKRAGADGPELWVVDDGPGVPRELHEILFEPYVTRREGGTGLGLAIVRRIACEHGWQVSHEAVEPQGAAFVLRGFTR